ncbi:MAG: polyprenyl synthetase family protein [Bacteriovoracaceae bacterium]|nr:polyprenyl synthetase family protein [Bacteriovoracaceae bacterium]
MLSEALHVALKKSSLHPELTEVMDYAVFPAGKLFRPRLVEAIALDLSKKVSPNHLHLASAIELHHAYTLVHDDLPPMDNDLIRRGKASTHAHYGEWKAILAGDALLIASFNEISNIDHKNFREILKLMSWTTGAKGLIEGQFRDLLADGKMNFQEVVRIHELKTGRLIQLATLGAYLLAEKQTFKEKVQFMRLGREIGVSFQLLDDLSELAVPDVSPHEKNINPFISNTEAALNELRLSHLRLTSILFNYRLDHTERMLQDYFKKNQEVLLNEIQTIEKNIGKDITNIKNWTTNFV